MQTLLRTPLYDRHVALGARLVPFAGWEMPVQYEGVIPEHLAVRNDCGVFDVSHMGELEVEGPGAREFLQSVLLNDLDRLGPRQAQYTLLTNEQGGIVDDLIVYERDPERFLLIVNASNREPDFSWLRDRDRRRSRLGLCAREGFHRCGGVAEDQVRGARAAPGGIRDGGPRDPAPGDGDPGRRRDRRRGHVGLAFADARPRDRTRLRCLPSRRAGSGADDRRPRKA